MRFGNVSRIAAKVRIATFNINGINGRLANLLAWLEEARPDVVCLQELRATDDAFPVEAVERAGYGAVWVGQSGFNGVAILAHDAEPLETRRSLPGDPADRQARYIEAAVNGVIVTSIYLPNGNPQPGPKFAYKLDWMERLRDHARALLAAGVPVVLAGDFNVVPTEFDVYPRHSYGDNALLQPAPRAAYAALVAEGWTDAIRTLHPDAPTFTFWDYKSNRWERDAGLRIDHLLLSPAIRDRLVAAGVDREVRGLPHASDHAPTWIDLAEPGAPKARRRRRQP